MTRKDYILIAQAMHRTNEALNGYDDSGTSPRQLHEYLCYSLMDALASDNPRFDRQRFMAACGIA